MAQADPNAAVPQAPSSPYVIETNNDVDIADTLSNPLLDQIHK